jgi:hypothetical protein
MTEAIDAGKARHGGIYGNGSIEFLAHSKPKLSSVWRLTPPKKHTQRPIYLDASIGHNRGVLCIPVISLI